MTLGSIGRTRYFHSANKLNVIVNFLSGNAFPLDDEDTSLSFAALSWVVLVGVIKVSVILATAMGSLYFADMTAVERFKKSGPAAAVCFELTILTVYLNLRRKDLRNLISMYNSILVDSDDLRKCIYDTVEPYKKGLTFYMVGCLIAVCAWTASPILQIYDHDEFTYGDYSPPVYLPGEPFGRKAFVGGVVFQILGVFFSNIAKLSIDVYISYFIAVLSAEYKYLRSQTSKVFSEKNNGENELMVIDALKNCVRHHSAVIEVGQNLAEILAFPIGATYMTCIFKFCFLAFGIITFESANLEKVTYIMYGLACIIQVFLLCSCIQELLDESTSVTQDAFHENWHSRSIGVKKIFGTMGVSNQIQCQLSAYGVVHLIVPTLAVILSKSYSVCLLLVEVN